MGVIMAIKSLSGVLNGSPEEIKTLNASLARAGLEPSTVRCLSLSTQSRTLSDFNNPETEDAGILLDMFEELAESLRRLRVKDGDGISLQEATHKYIRSICGNRFLHQRMANAMTRTLQQKDTCSALDLLTKGFTLKDIVRFWDMAKNHANIEMSKTADDIALTQLLIA